MIIAIDPSTAATGMAVFVDRKLVDVRFLTPPKRLTKKESDGSIDRSASLFAKRILYVFNALDEIFADIDLGVDTTLVLEDQYVGRSAKSSLILTAFRAAIQAYFVNRGCKIILVKPSTWQGAIFKQKIKDTKAASVSTVKVFYDLAVTHDEADAILLGHWYMYAKA